MKKVTHCSLKRDLFASFKKSTALFTAVGSVYITEKSTTLFTEVGRNSCWIDFSMHTVNKEADYSVSITEKKYRIVQWSGTCIHNWEKLPHCSLRWEEIFVGLRFHCIQKIKGLSNMSPLTEKSTTLFTEVGPISITEKSTTFFTELERRFLGLKFHCIQ